MSLTLKNIPIDWRVYPLGDIANFSQGIQVGTEKHISKLIDGYQRFIRIIDYTQPNNNDIRYVPIQGERYFANAKDIIMIRYGTPGVIGRGIEGVIANNMFKITFNQLVINDFAEHFFKFSETIKKINDGSASSTMPAINFGFLKKLPFVVPPLQEQQKIAEILSTVDAKIEVIDQQITETQALKKGLMQRLLTKGIGHTEFKDSTLGEIPKSWEVVTISEIAQIKGRIGYRGYTKEDIVEKGQGAISASPSNIKNNKLDFSKNTYISWFKYDESPEIQLEKNDILLVKTGSSFGKVAIVKDLIEKATINPQLVIFKTKEYNPHFLYYILADNAVQKQIIATIVGGAIPTLSQKNMLEFEIPQPQVEEQQKIADILNSVDDKLEVLFEKKTNYQELKQGLMQQLLTGKLRVNNLIAQI